MSNFIDEKTKDSVLEVMAGMKNKRAKALENLGVTEDKYKEKVTEIRKKVFGSDVDDFEENLKAAKKKLKKNGFHIHEARDAVEVREKLGEIITGSKFIAKSKTNTGREIEIEKALENFEYSETDLGDFLVDFLKGEDQHYVLPALHATAEEISKKVKEVYGDDVPADAEKLTWYLSWKIREKILKADVGITGANFFTKSGQVVLLENEGNISLVSRLPKKHVIVCGIEKLVETVEDATTLSRTAAIFGTGQEQTQYVSVISGPSKTADIQNQLVEGAQGAKEVHIVLVDNGRREMLEKPGFKDFWRCISCGSCLNFCPAFHELGKEFGGDAGIGARVLIFSAFGGVGDAKFASTTNLKRAKDNGNFDCNLCGNCGHNCPMKIKLPQMIREVRSMQNEVGVQTKGNKEMLDRIKKSGNPFGKVDDSTIPDEMHCC